jgi:hypothetical protein
MSVSRKIWNKPGAIAMAAKANPAKSFPKSILIKLEAWKKKSRFWLGS